MFGGYAFMKDSCNASPELFSEKMNFSSPAPRAVSERLYRLKQLEIFPLLPFRDFRLVARDFGLLDAQVVVDEIFAKAGGEAGIRAQRGERLLETFRQMPRPRIARRSTSRGARRSCAPFFLAMTTPDHPTADRRKVRVFMRALREAPRVAFNARLRPSPAGSR